MKANNFFFGIGIGVAVGYAISRQLMAQKISPDTALKKVKGALLETDIEKVIGTWIKTQAEKYVKDGLTYEVYNGGVSSKTSGFEKQHNFKIDAKTGTIIELQEEK
jgi:predicted small secreted protein